VQRAPREARDAVNHRLASTLLSERHLHTEGWIMQKWLMGACLCLGLAGSYGCDSEDNPIEDAQESVECTGICDKYQECFDSDYDTDKCEDNCKRRADDPDHLDQEERCSTCIDEKSCGDATFSCADDCIGIVP
jgi:hypothetical protein